MDLRVEIPMLGVRRLHVLVNGLPPESATRRIGGFPPVEELLATLVEQLGAWSLAQLQRTQGPKVQVPPTVHIRRPGESDEPPRRKRETDPQKIAAFFK